MCPDGGLQKGEWRDSAVKTHRNEMGIRQYRDLRDPHLQCQAVPSEGYRHQRQGDRGARLRIHIQETRPPAQGHGQQPRGDQGPRLGKRPPHDIHLRQAHRPSTRIILARYGRLRLAEEKIESQCAQRLGTGGKRITCVLCFNPQAGRGTSEL